MVCGVLRGSSGESDVPTCIEQTVRTVCPVHDRGKGVPIHEVAYPDQSDSIVLTIWDIPLQLELGTEQELLTTETPKAQRRQINTKNEQI